MGAIGFRRRRYLRKVSDEFHRRLLQWGHRLSSTETAINLLVTSALGATLQWGRRLSSTETASTGLVDNLGYTLQWGRRLSSTETSEGSSRRSSSDGFNGAVGFRRRRHADAEGRGFLSLQLQWGRRLRRRRLITTANGVPLEVLLQWGRRLSSTETYRAPWTIMVVTSMLQWGRRLSSTETLTTPASSVHRR